MFYYFQHYISTIAVIATRAINMNPSLFLMLFMLHGVLGAYSGTCPKNCDCSKEGTLECRNNFEKPYFPTIDSSNDVKEFHFIDCKIDIIEQVPYINAASLIINNCGVGEVKDGAFKLLSQLQTLDIENRGTSMTLSVNAFEGLDNLTTLELRSNKLSALPVGVFRPLKQLKHLDLSDNHGVLTTPRLFDNTSSQLTELICENCNLTSLPVTSLAPLRALTRLDLNHNYFSSIGDNAFHSTPNLLVLSLDSCTVKDISGKAFEGLVHLEKLILGYNLLWSFSDNIFQPFSKTLRTLHIEHNMFKTLSESLLPWNNLTELKLGNNPWECTCGIVWIRNLKESVVIDSQKVE